MLPCRAHPLTAEEHRMNQQQLVTTVEETREDWKMATGFAEAKMVPEHFRKSPGDCFIALQLARRFRMDAWSVMQELYIVNGRPMMSGKLATAILNNSLAEPLRPTYSGSGDDRTIVLTGRPEGDPEPLSVTLMVRDAKTKNENWLKIPDQMLMYSGARMWGRRFTPNILLGILFEDEEVPAGTAPIVPLTTEKPRTQIAAPEPAREAVIDENTGEVFEGPSLLSKDVAERWYDWGSRFVRCMRTSTDVEGVDAWLAANSELLAECAKEATKVHDNIHNAMMAHKMVLLRRDLPADAEASP